MLQVVSFIHIGEEKTDIAHLGPKGFFNLYKWNENKWYFTFATLQIIFFNFT